MTTVVAGILFAVPVLALAGALVFVGRRLHGALDGEARDLRHLRSERQKLLVNIRQSAHLPSIVDSYMETLAVIDQRIDDAVKRSAKPVVVKESEFLVKLRQARETEKRQLAHYITEGFPSLAKDSRKTIAELDAEIKKAEAEEAEERIAR